MEPDKFKQLIYAKGFNTELTQRLLKIADSSMVMEDLLELIDEEKEETHVEEPDSSDCDDCDLINTAESERDDAQDERDVAEKKFRDLKRNLSDLIVKFEDQAHRIISGVMPKKKIEPTGKTGVGKVIPKSLVTVIPKSLMHVKCECGNELFIDGKQEGWKVDFLGPVIFKCPCGKTRTVPIDAMPLTLCTACKAVDRNNPPCKTCDRPICPECEADNTDDPPCSTCERNRPHWLKW